MSTKAARHLDKSSPEDRTERRLASLDTSIDLAGDAAPERLIVERNRLLVLGGDDFEERRREWPLERVAGVRIEPSVGSCFLQAEVEGQWVDVLRWPGGADRPLVIMADRLNTRCRLGHWPDAERPPGGRPRAEWPGPAESEAEKRRSGRWRTVHRLVEIVRPFRASVVALLALSVGAVAIDVAPPMLQRLLVDRVLQADPAETPLDRSLLLLVAIVAGLLLFRIAATVFGIAKGYVSSRVGTSLTANLREELVRKLNELPLAFHDRNQVGMLMSRVAYDTETMHTVVYHLTSGFLLQSLQLLGIGVALFYLNPKLALVTMLPMPLILAGGWYFTRYLNPRNNHYWDAVGRQASALTGMLSGIRVVKAFVQEDRETERFIASSRRLRDSRQAVDVSTATFSAMMGFLFALGGLAVWYIGGRDVLGGTMTLGSLMAFLAYLAMFYTPLTSIAESTSWFSNFFTAMHRIFEILDAPGEREPARRAAPRPAGAGLAFERVSFGYDKHRPVLREIDFTIAPGETVGIVGRSGSGKSTLVSLIGRLYEPDAGRVLLGGDDVRDLDRRQLRRRIGMVPQEPFLFRGSVAANITYGNAGASPEQILRAARLADAHDFIMRMPFGYETQLGEGGSGLSVGERQRLSIARALLFDPEILILDEATASVDAETERAICDAIRRFSRGRTSIIIAHRLSTLRDADRLLVFDQGRLIEQGTHAELLDRDGLYANLIRLQWDLKENRRRVHSALAGQDPQGPTALLDVTPEDTFLASLAGGPARDNGEPAEGPQPSSAELRWLERGAVFPDMQGGLRVVADGEDCGGVYAAPAFPATHPRQFICLRRRDGSGRDVEVGMIDTLDHWPRAVEQAITRSLGRRHLLRPICELRRVRTRGSLLEIAAETDEGPVRFQVEKPGEGFQSFGPAGLLLRDTQGNYYVIPDRGGLPRRQQRLLALYFGE